MKTKRLFVFYGGVVAGVIGTLGLLLIVPSFLEVLGFVPWWFGVPLFLAAVLIAQYTIPERKVTE